jgi:hypothetical protein
MPRTLELAKEIVDVATQHHVSTWDNPDAVTDQAILKRADELVEACLQATAGRTVSQAVLEILHAAHVEPLSGPSREAYVQHFGEPAATNGQTHDPAKLDAVVEAAQGGASAFATTTSPPSAPSEAQGSIVQEQASSDPVGSPEPAKEAAPAAGEDQIKPVSNYSIEDIFPGYDDQTVKDIVELVLVSAKSKDLSREEWTRIKSYEATHEKRPEILSLEPEFEEAEPPHDIVTNESTGEQMTVSAVSTFGSTVAGDSRDTGHTASPGDDDVSLEAVYAGEVQTRAQQEGLPIPHDADFSGAPNLPLDITGINDEQLTRLGTQFHSYFARGQWLLSQEEGRATLAEHLEREAEHDAYVRAYALHKEQIPEEKRTQPTALEAARKQAEKDAEVAESVRTWRNRRVNHSVQAREIKALCLGFDKAVWRVDKELDMRMRAATTARAAS